ncbi:MAG: sortase [Candidatus Paceibacterota bacterium]
MIIETLKKENPINFIKHRKWPFLLDFFIVCFITFGFLYMFGWVPDELKMTFGRYPAKEILNRENAEVPLSIRIPVIDVDAQVYNPQSTSTEVLDSFLARGAVRYPGSGLLGYGNIFIFGHNSRLAVVNNQAYKTFNNLRDLKTGDLIYIDSDKNEFIFKVSSLKMEGADKALVTFDTKVHRLTLVTCNTFGAKSDRYVLEAEFVSKHPLSAK